MTATSAQPITVCVTFPDGLRDVPARIETPGWIEGRGGGYFAGPRPVPNTMSGWRFVETIDGRWYAVPTSAA